MKMSDYFKGYVSKIYGDYLGNVCFVVEGQRIDVELDFDKCESAVLHAINNHDRLTEENAKLRGVLESIQRMQSRTPELPDDYSHEDVGQLNDRVDEIFGNVNTVLTELKEQGNE